MTHLDQGRRHAIYSAISVRGAIERAAIWLAPTPWLDRPDPIGDVALRTARMTRAELRAVRFCPECVAVMVGPRCNECPNGATP